MRHRRIGKKLGRKSSHRKAMICNLMISLLEHGQIKTTLTRAKELPRYLDPLITKAKKVGDGNNTAAIHQGLRARLRNNKGAVEKLLKLGKLCKDRPGGYTGIYKLSNPRQHDCAKMAVIRFVDYDVAYGDEEAAPQS